MHWSQDSAALKLITLSSEECLSMFKSSELPSCQLHDDKNDILVKEKKKNHLQSTTMRTTTETTERSTVDRWLEMEF